MLDILLYICPRSVIFWQIPAFSELIAYSGVFRTIDIFNQFQARYSGITQEQIMHILNLI